MKLWRERQTWQGKKAEQKLADLDVDSIKSIVVIKYAAFGDLLCTRPFLVTLKQFFPSASITFCNISHYTRGTPEDLVDHVFTAPGKNSSLSFWGKYKEIKKLGEHDLLFDLTASTPSLILSLLTKAKFKIGFQYRNIHKRIYDVAIPRAQFRFEAETFLEQLHILGIQYELPLKYQLPVTAAQRKKPYLVYFPTCSTLDRVWPIERMTELISEMSELYPEHEHIILSGLADWEIELANKIELALTARTNVLKVTAGPDDPALIKGAVLLVANDTGIRHLAIALETPTVGLLSFTAPFGYWPRFGHHEVVYESDGSVPSVDKVKQAVIRILTK